MDNIFYVYRHIRLDTNTPFYVGKGKDDRAWFTQNRNKYWKHIVDKHGYIVEIIEENLTEEQALIKEVELIRIYKNLGYCEANMTLGGEGSTGYKHTAETIEKMSKSKIGKKCWMRGKRGKDCPNYGKKHSEETKAKMGINSVGKKHSPESIKKMKEIHGGKNNPRHKWYWRTPNGTYESSYIAAGELNMNRKKLERWCLQDNKPEWYKIPKKEYENER